MQTITVSGSRPSEDFQVTRGSINRLGAGNLMDVPQSVVVINRALMQSQGVTTARGCCPQCARCDHRLGRGRCNIGTNINLNGFSARTGHLSRWHARPWPVLPGRVRSGAGRGTDGPIVDAVRPWLDRRRHQPGDEEALPEAGDGTQRLRPRPMASCAQRPTSTCRFEETNAARVSMPCSRSGKASTLDQTNVLDFGIAPSVKLGIGTPTEITLVGDPAAQEGPGGLRRAEPQRLSRSTCRATRPGASTTDYTAAGRRRTADATVDHKFAIRT
jgi:catecholate siderophore receptor